MAASQKTIAEVVVVFKQWQKDFGLPDSAIAMLLRRLGRIEGNQSVNETLERIATLYRVGRDES